MGNDFYERMCKEAQEELASGEKGWREAPTNVLLLACFGLLTNHLTHKITRPLWVTAYTVIGGLIAAVIINVFG